MITIKRRAAAALAALALAANAQAAPNDDECAIWLCMAGASMAGITIFAVDGCDDAARAFVKRTAQFESPAPSFASCSADGTDRGFSITSGYAAKLPEGSKRANYRGKYGTFRLGRKCQSSGSNQSARREDNRTVPGCRSTWKFYRITEENPETGDKRLYTYLERSRRGGDGARRAGR